MSQITKNVLSPGRYAPNAPAWILSLPTAKTKDWRGCVQCDFYRGDDVYPQVRELETRVNVDEATKAAQTQVIKIIP